MSTSFVEVMARHASQAPLAPAVSDPTTDWNHRQLWDQARRVGAALARRGVGPGDLVGTALPSGASHFAVLLGIMATGAAAAPLNVRLAPGELARYLDAVRPGLVVAEPDWAGPGIATCPVGELLETAAEAWVPVPVGPREPALVFGTGGTTGTPKGALWTGGSLAAYLASSALALEARRTDVELYFAPFFHVALATCAMSTLYAGGGVRFEPRFDAERVVQLIREGAVTRLFGPPTALDRIIGHPGFEHDRSGSVRTVLFGSTVSEPGLPDRLREAFPRATLVTGYGATEFGAVTRLRSWEAGGDLAGVGWPVPGVEIDIHDGEGRPVGEDREDSEDSEDMVGELVVRAPWQMAGYLTDGVLDPVPDGGVRSGDLASRGPDGRLWLRGRLKEVVITGGENVFPVEVERVLCEHEAVSQAAVVGVPDAEWGERVEAVVVVTSATAGRDPDLPGELARHCRRHLAGYKAPKRIVVCPELPLTSTMKVDKLAVKEWLGEH